MPFTLSHPAAVLPLARRPLVASALVAGAMTPDLPYVLPQATSAAWGPYSDFTLTYTHEPGTGLVAGTVLAVILLALYHHLLKRPLLALLPSAAAGRLAGAAAGFRWTGGAQPAWIAVSAVLGVLTHLLWDALVHENGSAPWSPTVTSAVWWASTVIGAVAIAVQLYRWWRRTPPAAHPVLGPRMRWATLGLLLAAGVAGAVVTMVWDGIGPAEAVRSTAALREVVTGGMSGVAAGVLLHALLWQILAGRSRPSRVSR